MTAPASVPKMVLRAACAAMALAAALFAIGVGALLLANRKQLEQANPLNAPALTALRQQYAEAPDDPVLKERIREADLEARRAYFTVLARAERGGRLLTGSVLALLAGLAAYAGLGAEPPDLALLDPPGAGRRKRAAGRRGLLAASLLLLAAAVLAVVLNRSTGGF